MLHSRTLALSRAYKPGSRMQTPFFFLIDTSQIPFNMDTLPASASASAIPANSVSSALTPPIINILHLANGAQDSGDTQGANSWVERNPQKPVQPAWVRPKLMDTQKRTKKLSSECNRAARVTLSADILALIATRKTQIDELAEKHCVTSQHIEKLVDNSSHYKKSCAPNLANALVHMKANELNESMCPNMIPPWLETNRLKPDLPQGSKLSLKDIKQATSEDVTYQDMSEEAKQDACAQLLAHRHNKATAARLSNDAAAKDAVATMAIQEREVCLFVSQLRTCLLK